MRPSTPPEPDGPAGGTPAAVLPRRAFRSIFGFFDFSSAIGSSGGPFLWTRTLTGALATVNVTTAVTRELYGVGGLRYDRRRMSESARRPSPGRRGAWATDPDSGPMRRGLISEATEIESADGTSIACYVTREPFPGAKTVVLANGLGGPRLAWRSLVEYLGDRYRFVTWDYRGLYGSRRPPAGADPYAIARHVDDLAAVLDHFGVREASLVGWSMGVQVCLEAFRRVPGVAKNLVLLNGTFGRPLDTAVVPWGRRFLVGALDVAERFSGPLGVAMRGAAAQPEFVGWMKRLGMMADTVDEAEFAEVVGMFAGLDVEVFLKTLRALGSHDAERILPEVDVPTLVVTGDRDRLTPRGLSQQMVRRIPRAEILVVRGATHYTAVEFPELVGLRIERFFREHAF
jgi:pimeloyl-ACP methyl ester carboxylesterase